MLVRHEYQLRVRRIALALPHVLFSDDLESSLGNLKTPSDVARVRGDLACHQFDGVVIKYVRLALSVDAT
jgi:hypothetical protein